MDIPEYKNDQLINDDSGKDLCAEKNDVIINKLAELKILEESLSARESVLSRKEAEILKKQMNLNEELLQAKNNFPQIMEEKFAVVRKQLEEREAKCEIDWREIEKTKSELREREQKIRKAEIEREEGFQEKEKAFEEKLNEKQNEIELEINGLRISKMRELEQDIEKEREIKLAAIASEIEKRKKEFETENEGRIRELKNKENQLNDREIHVTALEIEKLKTKSLQDKLIEELKNNKQKIAEGIADERESLKAIMINKDREIGRLLESLSISTNLINNFSELKRKLNNEDPATVLLKLKTYEEEIKELRDELVNRPTVEMQVTFDRLKSEKEELQRNLEKISKENKILRENAKAQSELEMQIAELSQNNKSLQSRYDSVDIDNNRLMAELKRLQTSYDRDQDRERRIQDIENPYFTASRGRNNNNPDEIEWLENISKSCKDYGLKFPRRILYAFHTALKTAEWSPLTVLSGVSGTGKSELPRLYSHFGGINFFPLSVQPNWDSQESMLGYFNSIDNKFDAQPVLRLLAQTQKKSDDNYPGLYDYMTIVLMDEMNLAHVELYFSEFLSKLELRRGCKSELPNLEVKLGSGIKHYDLMMGRNVLWVGTMNQDETTKSLSDKVLDRGIIINFPRPTKMERRKKLMELKNPGPLLLRTDWQKWWQRESLFSDSEIASYKEFIEEMNKYLSKVGRALGHRVWQSIEYYMSNYPDVLKEKNNREGNEFKKAMDLAFEDQLVQKVMPKLRGIETRGKARTDCLDKIRTLLENKDFKIVEDFKLACEFGYGQFIWNSANYLIDDENMDDDMKT